MTIVFEDVAIASRGSLPAIVLEISKSWVNEKDVERDCKKIVKVRIDRSKAKDNRGKFQAARADLTPARKALAASGLDAGLVQVADRFLKLGERDREHINEEAVKDVAKRHKTRKTSKAFEFEYFRAIAADWIESSDPILAGIAVLIATGRRPAEVFGLTEFKPFDENKCWVKRLCKKPDSVEFDNDCYVIPVLLDSELIVAAIERIRLRLPASSWLASGAFNDSEVYHAVLKVYDEKFRQVFEGHGFTGQALRNFRYLYEAAVYELADLSFKEELHPSEYVSAALSHDSAQAGRNYARFKIVFKDAIALPQFDEIGNKGKSPEGSPFADSLSYSLDRLYGFIDEILKDDPSKALLCKARISEAFAQGMSIEQLTASIICANGLKPQTTSLPSAHQKANGDISAIVDAMMEHNEAVAATSPSNEIAITFSSVQRVLAGWKNGKRLAASLWEKIEQNRGSDIDSHHEKFEIDATRHNYSLRGDKMNAIVSMVVKRLNA